MALFYDFEKYFGYTEICKIETTYRFHQPLIEKSSNFIKKNPEQKEKTIKTPDGDTKQTSIHFIPCDIDNIFSQTWSLKEFARQFGKTLTVRTTEVKTARFANQQGAITSARISDNLVMAGINSAQDVLTHKDEVQIGQFKESDKYILCRTGAHETLYMVEKIVDSIPQDEDILLLGRYNYDATSVGFTGNIRDNDFRIRVKIAGRELSFMSVHSAKGLEADHVILINCNQGTYGFPSLIEDDPILDFVLCKSEQYPFAEERRLFYVAMTRAKKSTYVLYDPSHPSIFISEFKINLEVGSYLCPKCLEGKVKAIGDGITVNGDEYRSFACTNNEAGCDFFETRYGNDITSPGILITENMTAEDVEQLRMNRRR